MAGKTFGSGVLRGTASLMALTVAVGTAWAQATATFDIAAQPLDEALIAFSEQSGVIVMAASALTKGRRGVAVTGELTPRAALRRMLAGSGLSMRDDGHGALMLTQAAPAAPPDQDADDRKQAEEPEDREIELEEMVVTGTNIRGVVNPTTPVLRFDRTDIEQSGAATVQEFLRTIPQNFASTTPLNAESANPFSQGNLNPTQGSGVDLRGLGAGSTLTLLNGRRMAASGFGSFVDISILPLGLIERVEVLTDGASAIYGSDAVGGVVNFITRDAYDGLELSARYGTATQGSRQDIQFGGGGGTSWGTGGGYIAAEYIDLRPLLTSKRDFIDIGEANPVGTLGPESEKVSVAGSINQRITDRLSASVDLLFSNRKARNSQIGFNQLNFRRNQSILYVNSRVEYDVTDRIAASFFFDYGEENNNGADDRDNFESVAKRKNRSLVAEGQISGPLLRLPAGPLSFAAGSLYREESYEEVDGTISPPAKRDIVSVYGELLVPILGEGASLPFVKNLELSLAGRYEDYSDFGDTFNPKAGLYWALNDDFSVRGPYSQSFRAPRLSAVFSPQSVNISAVPLSVFTAVTPPPPDDRLDDDRAPEGRVSVILFSGGNPQLTEETADIWAAGFEFQPSFVPGLTIEATYYNIAYTDRIEFVGFLDPIQIPEFSALVDIPPDVDFVADLFARAEDGSIFLRTSSTIPFDPRPEDIQVLMRTGSQNLASRDVSGLDVTVRYQVDTEYGSFSAALNAAYMLDYKVRQSEGADVVEQINILYRPIDLKLRGNLSWSRGGFTAFAAVNYIDSYRDHINRAIANKIGSWTTVDLSISYDTADRFSSVWLDDARIGLNIRNLFDEDPPFVATPADGFNYDPANADPLGRFISVSVSKLF